MRLVRLLPVIAFLATVASQELRAASAPRPIEIGFEADNRQATWTAAIPSPAALQAGTQETDAGRAVALPSTFQNLFLFKSGRLSSRGPALSFSSAASVSSRGRAPPRA